MKNSSRKSELESLIEEFLSDFLVRDLMVPRKETVTLKANMSVKESLKVILEDKYTRYPVYDEKGEQIIGILNSKDLLRLLLEADKTPLPKLLDEKVKSFVSPPLFVSEISQLNELAKKFKQKKERLAIVVDEYGEFVGIISLEDITEALLGSFPDREEDGGEEIIKVDDDTLIVKGSTSLKLLENFLDLEFDNEEVSTVSGFLMKILQKLPKPGDEVKVNDWKFLVEKVEDNLVETVRVMREEKEK